MFTLFSNADFEGVEFYAARRYVHLTKEGREEDFFVNEGEEEEDEVLSFSPTPLVVEQRVGGIEFSDLPCFASWQIRTSLLRTWLIYSAKVSLLRMTMTLLPINFQVRCNS